MDTVSIIVPVYNAEKYLDACVASICAQDYPAIEILLVDDGSTDHSGEICDRWAAKDPRITVIHQENSGSSDARRNGLHKAAGKYVCFVDDDDLVTKDYASVLVRCQEETDAEVVICGYQTMTEERCITDTKGTDDEAEIITGREALLRLSGREFLKYVVFWNKLFLKNRINDNWFRNKCTYSDDENFSYQMYDCSEKIAVMNRSLYMYRVNENSLTRRTISAKRIQSEIEIHAERIQYFETKSDGEMADRFRVCFMHRMLYFWINYRDDSKQTQTDNCKKLMRKTYRETYFRVIRSRYAPKRSKIALTVYYICPRLYRVLHGI